MAACVRLLIHRHSIRSATADLVWRLVSVLVVGWLIAGCGTSVSLPDRSNPAVEAEEARLALLLETTDDSWIPKPRDCMVRLLGQDGSISYVWAFCQGPELVAGERPAESVPARIDGDHVSQPRDGSLYAEDVETMFPGDLAAAILDSDPRLFP